MPLRHLPFWVATALLVVASCLFYEYGDRLGPPRPPVPGVEVVLAKQVVRGTLTHDGDAYAIEMADGQKVSFALEDAIMMTFPGPFPKDEQIDIWEILRVSVPAAFICVYLAYVLFLLRGKRTNR